MSTNNHLNDKSSVKWMLEVLEEINKANTTGNKPKWIHPDFYSIEKDTGGRNVYVPSKAFVEQYNDVYERNMDLFSGVNWRLPETPEAMFLTKPDYTFLKPKAIEPPSVVLGALRKAIDEIRSKQALVENIEIKLPDPIIDPSSYFQGDGTLAPLSNPQPTNSVATPEITVDMEYNTRDAFRESLRRVVLDQHTQQPKANAEVEITVDYVRGLVKDANISIDENGKIVVGDREKLRAYNDLISSNRVSIEGNDYIINKLQTTEQPTQNTTTSPDATQQGQNTQPINTNFDLQAAQSLINKAYREGGNTYSGAAEWYFNNIGKNFNALVRERDKLRGTQTLVQNIKPTTPPIQDSIATVDNPSQRTVQKYILKPPQSVAPVATWVRGVLASGGVIPIKALSLPAAPLLFQALSLRDLSELLKRTFREDKRLFIP